jgi:hypothetical protein
VKEIKLSEYELKIEMEIRNSKKEYELFTGTLSDEKNT